MSTGKPTLRVEVDLGFLGNYRTYVAEVVISDIAKECYEPIVVPSHDANGIERVFCSNSRFIRQQTINRKHMAKLLAEHLTEHIMKSMEMNDTEMGYSKA